MALAVGAGGGVVAGGGLLLLGWHGFERRGEKGEGLGKPQQPPINFFLQNSKSMLASLQERLQKSKLVLVVVLIVAAIVAVASFYEDTFSSSVVEMSDLGGLTHGGPPP